MINERTVSLEASLQLITNLIHMDKSIKDVESYVKVYDSVFSVFRFDFLGNRQARGYNYDVDELLHCRFFADLQRQSDQLVKPKINDRLDAKLRASFDMQLHEKYVCWPKFLVI